MIIKLINIIINKEKWYLIVKIFYNVVICGMFKIRYVLK